jgi:hypothetical protein
VRSDDSALLIVAHGSTVNPDSSVPALAHAAEIRRRKIFWGVGYVFWKEPSLRDAIFYSIPNRSIVALVYAWTGEGDRALEQLEKLRQFQETH